MIYEVEISKQAEADLRGIFEYIAYTLLAPKNASGQLERLEHRLVIIGAFFMLGEIPKGQDLRAFFMPFFVLLILTEVGICRG